MPTDAELIEAGRQAILSLFQNGKEVEYHGRRWRSEDLKDLREYVASLAVSGTAGGGANRYAAFSKGVV